jgi:hypothetical protein
MRVTRSSTKARVALFIEQKKNDLQKALDTAKAKAPKRKGKGKDEAKVEAATAAATATATDPVEEAAPVQEAAPAEQGPVIEVEVRASSPPATPTRGSSPPASPLRLSGRRKRDASLPPDEETPSKRRRVASSSPVPSGSSLYADTISDNNGHPIGDIWEDDDQAEDLDQPEDFMVQYHGTIFGLAVIEEESEPDSEASLDVDADERSASPPERSSSPSIGEVEFVRKECLKCLKAEEKERQKRKRSVTW